MVRKVLLRQCGWTLVEQLTVIAIVALLASLSVTGVKIFLAYAQGQSMASDLMSSLSMARIAAITKNERVALCSSVDGEHCSNQPDWGTGWLVFVDDSNNGVRDSSELVLRSHKASSSQLVVWANQPVNRYVSYHPLGISMLTSGAFQAGSFYICSDRASLTGIRLIISSSGRIRQEEVTPANCPPSP